MKSNPTFYRTESKDTSVAVKKIRIGAVTRNNPANDRTGAGAFGEAKLVIRMADKSLREIDVPIYVGHEDLFVFDAGSPYNYVAWLGDYDMSVDHQKVRKADKVLTEICDLIDADLDIFKQNIERAIKMHALVIRKMEIAENKARF